MWLEQYKTKAASARQTPAVTRVISSPSLSLSESAFLPVVNTGRRLCLSNKVSGPDPVSLPQTARLTPTAPAGCVILPRALLYSRSRSVADRAPVARQRLPEGRYGGRVGPLAGPDRGRPRLMDTAPSSHLPLVASNSCEVFPGWRLIQEARRCLTRTPVKGDVFPRASRSLEHKEPSSDWRWPSACVSCVRHSDSPYCPCRMSISLSSACSRFA